MNKGYVILEVGYEYNDEIYHAGYYGDSFEAPNEVYTDKDKADAELTKRTNDKLRGLELGYYCYGIDEITNHEEELIKFLNEELKMETNMDEFYDVSIPSSATDEQLEKLQKLITLNFFQLKEVELVG
jgi:hypothetical protein